MQSSAACALMKVSRSTLTYELKMPAKSAPVVHAMRRLSGKYPRFGARRIQIFLRREGLHLG